MSVLRKVVALPLPVGSDRSTPRAMALLQQAALSQASVVIGYVDAAGVATQRVVAPI